MGHTIKNDGSLISPLSFACCSLAGVEDCLSLWVSRSHLRLLFPFLLFLPHASDPEQHKQRLAVERRVVEYLLRRAASSSAGRSELDSPGAAACDPRGKLPCRECRPRARVALSLSARRRAPVSLQLVLRLQDSATADGPAASACPRGPCAPPPRTTTAAVGSRRAVTDSGRGRHPGPPLRAALRGPSHQRVAELAQLRAAAVSSSPTGADSGVVLTRRSRRLLSGQPSPLQGPSAMTPGRAAEGGIWAERRNHAGGGRAPADRRRHSLGIWAAEVKRARWRLGDRRGRQRGFD
ncbi:unnamed protein product [Urochloa humidicola]